MMNSKRIKYLTVINKIMSVIFAVFWGMMAIGFFYRAVERRYLYPVKYTETVFECADYYGIDRALLLALINVESSFDKDAKSSAGAIGLMQITERTAGYIATMLGVESYDLYDEYTNVWFGSFYLKYLIGKFAVIDTALCAYNAGEGNVVIWLNTERYSIDGIHLTKVPYEETEAYVKKVNANCKKYKNLYKDVIYKI